MPITPKPNADTSKAALPVPSVRWAVIVAALASPADAALLPAAIRVAACTLSNAGETAKAAPTAAAVFKKPRRLKPSCLFRSSISILV